MEHEVYMRRCLDLAVLGSGEVSPNPMVGSVIVHQERIIGEGWHRKAGEAHAEVHAIASVEDHELLKQSTLYVSLEPCSHHGKTPPCSDLIIEKGIPHVVIAMQDPFALVDGAGIRHLRAAGIRVDIPVLEKEAMALNRRFICFHQKARPYIILKWAQSQQGFLAPHEHSGVHWISHPDTQQLTHQWRSAEDAILIGGRTWRKDDPSLTTRAFPGRDPLRIVWSSRLDDMLESRILKDEYPAVFFNKQRSGISGNKEFILSKGDDLSMILNFLYQRSIQSVIVEGGAQTLRSFIDAGLWDEARVIIGNREISGGVKAPLLSGDFEERNFGNDIIRTYMR